MFPDPPYSVYCMTASSLSTIGTTHLLPLLLESNKHIAIFFIGDLVLHEPHPLFLRFTSVCKQFKSLRPVMVGRFHRLGGLRKPDWADDDTLFLATNSARTDRTYGMNGRYCTGLIIVRPDGYVAYSTRMDSSGNAFQSSQVWLESHLA
jgi:hypothetical protein